MNSRNKQIILIALSVLLVVLFLFMPEQPLEVRKQLDGKSPSPEASTITEINISTRVETAIRAVQSENPMAGIQDLLSIVKEDSTQVDAHYYLGLFSIQTSQFEKAADRFEKVITFAGLKKYPDTRFKLAVCLEELGNKAGAISQLEQYHDEISTDEVEKRDAVLKELDRLRN